MSFFREVRKIEAEIEKEVAEVINHCTGSSVTGAGHHHHEHHFYDPIAEWVFKFMGKGGV